MKKENKNLSIKEAKYIVTYWLNFTTQKLVQLIDICYKLCQLLKYVISCKKAMDYYITPLFRCKVF